MLKIRSVAGVISALAVCGAAHAADIPQWQYSIGPGITIPANTPTENERRPSVSLDANAFYGWNSFVSIGPEIGYTFGMRNKGVINGSAFHGDSYSSTAETRLFHATGEVKVGPAFNLGPLYVKPYAIGGGGFYWTHTTDGIMTVQTENGVGQAPDPNEGNSSNGGWNAGAGVDVIVGGALLGIDFRYHSVINGGSASNNDYFVPSLRLGLFY